MTGLLVMLGWLGLGMGASLLGASLVIVLVAFCTQDRVERRKNFIFAGKFVLAGLVIFAIGFGSCALSFSQ